MALRAPNRNRRGNPVLGTAPRPANCACSVAMPAPMSTSRAAVLPVCASRKVTAFKARQGQLYSYAINHRPRAGFTPPTLSPSSARRGPAHDGNIIDCLQTPEALELDMRLEVAFEIDDKITFPTSSAKG